MAEGHPGEKQYYLSGSELIYYCGSRNTRRPVNPNVTLPTTKESGIS